jgi:hypothetical protein
MTDKTTEAVEDELIVVETPPEDDKKLEDEQVPGGKTEEADDEDDGDEDERLSQSEDDSDEEITGSDANRKRRQKRREMQKKARDAAQRELAMLRRTVAELSQRVSATETHTAQTTIQTLEQRLAQAKAEVEQAEFIIAKAVEAGNGADVTAAMRIRDDALRQAQQLETARQASQNRPAPQVNPQVVSYARQWMEANPWYDPTGRDRDSATTKAIDAELAREGYDPATREYWQELTARVAEAVGDDDDAGEPARKQTPDTPRRKAPPTGKTREHAPQSTKREIYVTPERKQAMIEAGVWDDPILRQRYLKAYQAYDTGSAR